MLITERRARGIFKVKEIWFADEPFDISGCDSVVFRACKKSLDVPGFTRTEFPTLVLDLRKSLEEIWQGFDKKSCRYEINRAERDGVYPLTWGIGYKIFEKLNKEFREKKGLGKTLPYDYMIRYCNVILAGGTAGYLAGQVYLEDKTNIRWLLGASKRLETNNPLIGAANRALIWEAIKYAKAKGIEEFDFGGYNPDLPTINFFKESFGPVKVTHYIYEKIYNPLYKVGKWLYEN
jgi:lipid II:glycine glycyltransferase (peptidoglycan interpeptide bridge formation enzyme)